MYEATRPIRRSIKPLVDLADRLDALVRKRLWLQILIGMALGITVGLLLSPTGASLVPANTAETLGAWLALPGNLFLALIQMVVIPLVVSSILLGVTSSGSTTYLRRIGVRILPYFVATTLVAVTIGIILALSIEPGQYISAELVAAAAETEPAVTPVAAPSPATEISIPDRIVNIIPTNPLAAALHSSMFQIVVFAMLIGVALVSIPRERAEPLIGLAGSLQEVSMQVVSWAMLIAPYAVFGLLAQITIKIGFDAIVGMGAYVGSVLLGLVILLGFYLVIVAVLARRSPWTFLTAAREAQLLAFSTSSSAAVMPVTIRTAQDKLGVRKEIAQFVVPLGATINMDGTALYQVLAAVFLTQVYGIELTIANLVLLTMTTVGASIGSPSSPGVGIVILSTILVDLGVPISGIALIFGVDRILDMARTVVNVTGDLTASTVMDRWLGDVPTSEPDAS